MGPEVMTAHVIEPAKDDIHALVDQILAKRYPELRATAPAAVKRLIHRRVDDRLPSILAQVVDVVDTDRATRETPVVCAHLSFLGVEAGCLRSGLVSVYLGNLTRLGVVVVPDHAVAGEEVYELLGAQAELTAIPRPRGRFTKRRVRHKGVEPSPFGRSIFEACFA